MSAICSSQLTLCCLLLSLFLRLLHFESMLILSISFHRSSPMCGNMYPDIIIVTHLENAHLLINSTLAARMIFASPPGTHTFLPLGFPPASAKRCGSSHKGLHIMFTCDTTFEIRFVIPMCSCFVHAVDVFILHRRTKVIKISDSIHK